MIGHPSPEFLHGGDKPPLVGWKVPGTKRSVLKAQTLLMRSTHVLARPWCGAERGFLYWVPGFPWLHSHVVQTEPSEISSLTYITPLCNTGSMGIRTVEKLDCGMQMQTGPGQVLGGMVVAIIVIYAKSTSETAHTSNRGALPHLVHDICTKMV